jgi:hypothetical protein
MHALWCGIPLWKGKEKEKEQEEEQEEEEEQEQYNADTRLSVRYMGEE